MKYLHENRFELILDWCSVNVVANKHALFDDLLFDIHSQKYCSLLSLGHYEEALAYAKQNFGAFRGTKLKGTFWYSFRFSELKRLMTGLAFAGTGFYQQFIKPGDNDHKKLKTEKLLQEAFCKFYNLALSSPMSLW